VLKGYDNCLKDLSVIRRRENLSKELKTQQKNLIIISSEINIPDSLKELITVIEFPLPSYLEIQEEIKRLVNSLQQNISSDRINELTVACQGLSLERIRRVFSKIIAQYGEIDESSPGLILEEKNNNIIYLKCKEKDMIISLVNYLYQMEITSIIIEGGFKTLTSFINNNYWDEARVIVGNKLFKNGLKSPLLNKKWISKDEIGQDTLLKYLND
jgi:riboflavin biosynthesis pyrimidine reductase